MFRRQRPQWRLADAQRAVARGYGFTNWPSLKVHVEKIRHERQPAFTSPRALKSREDSSPHPIAGAWIADQAHQAQRARSSQDSVVEFQVNGEEIKLTQVATDPTGQEIAITTMILPDGREHPVPFGEGVRLKALWTTPLMLEAAFTTSEGTLSTWSYEVSQDGKSMVISTAKDRIVFRRFRS